jgi:hypothetical protein
MRRIHKLASTLLLACGLAACSDDPLEPAFNDFGEDVFGAMLSAESGEDRSAAHSAAGGARNGTPLFDRLNAAIPGFGGLYRTSRCAIVVVLTARDGAAEALRIVHAAVEPLLGEACAAGVRVTAETGEFTYDELRRYLYAARPLLQLRGVERAQIDYRLNRLVIVVASREVARRVLASLPRTGIPEAAVTFRGVSTRPTATR